MITAEASPHPFPGKEEGSWVPAPRAHSVNSWGSELGGGLGSMTASPQEEQGEWGPSSPKTPLQELFTMLGTGLQE